MLDAAAALVRPGGVLVYATCSLEPEENEAVVAASGPAAPTSFPIRCRRPSRPSAGAAPDVLRTWPHRHDTDGFTAHRLRRRP